MRPIWVTSSIYSQEALCHFLCLEVAFIFDLKVVSMKALPASDSEKVLSSSLSLDKPGSSGSETSPSSLVFGCFEGGSLPPLTTLLLCDRVATPEGNRELEPPVALLFKAATSV